jgi:hypothetical protein
LVTKDNQVLVSKGLLGKLDYSAPTP